MRLFSACLHKLSALNLIQCFCFCMLHQMLFDFLACIFWESYKLLNHKKHKHFIVQNFWTYIAKGFIQRFFLCVILKRLSLRVCDDCVCSESDQCSWQSFITGKILSSLRFSGGHFKFVRRIHQSDTNLLHKCKLM